MVDKNLSAITKNIKVGKFYFIHDGSKTGHPGFVVWKDDEANIYLAIKFGSTCNDHNFPFGRPVGKHIDQSYIYKRAFLGKRKDFSRTILNDMHITKKELQCLFKRVNFINPVFSVNANRKDKRYFKKAMSNKKSPFQGQLSGYETRK